MVAKINIQREECIVIFRCADDHDLDVKRDGARFRCTGSWRAGFMGFLDPDFAPGVGTTVPGGATVREGHLCMELIADSGLMTSLDLVELNPFLDERGRTAQLMVDLAASALGRRVFDRPTRAYSS